MSKPKNMTPEEEAAWTERKRHYHRVRYEIHGERIREERKKYYATDPKLMIERTRIYTKKNPEKARKWSANYTKKNPEKVKALSLVQRRELRDSYIAVKLGIPVSILREYLPNLLESKRQEILLRRQLNPKTNQ